MMVPPLFDMRLCSLSVPSAPVLDEPTIVTATTIRITGSVSSGSVVTRFVVEWQRDTSVGCSDVNERTISVTGPFTSYTIMGLEPGNSYLITVTVSNSAGTAPVSSPPVTAMTQETGERERVPDTQWFVLSSTAPTGAPDGVSEVSVTANSITVQWGEVPCMDRNGEITGYTLEVYISGMIVVTESVNDGSAREGTVSGLTPTTEYTVTVAAVNSVGSGPFSGISIATAGWCDTEFSVGPQKLMSGLFLHTRWTQCVCHLLNHYISDHLMGTGGGSDCYLILHLLLCH